MTDVPCMKMTKQRGGYSIAVHKPSEDIIADGMLLHNRADFSCVCDYSAGSELETVVSELIRQIKATNDLTIRHESQFKAAYRRSGNDIPPDAGMRGGLPETDSGEEFEY